MSIIEQLRARGTEPTSLTTTDGVVTGYLNQALLADRTVFALVGDTLATPAHEATVVALDAISTVAPAS